MLYFQEALMFYYIIIMFLFLVASPMRIIDSHIYRDLFIFTFANKVRKIVRMCVSKIAAKVISRFH